jgi:hypothetical protein
MIAPVPENVGRDDSQFRSVGLQRRAIAGVQRRNHVSARLMKICGFARG